jgi:5-hydroxyisourate hydrolase-like protein (transthyretin family)
MKTHKIIFRSIALTMSFIVISFAYSFAQTDSAPKEKLSTSIQLSLHKKADLSKIITVKVTAKTKDNKRVPAQNALVNFYAQNKDGQKNIGKCTTDKDGKSELVLSKDLPMDTGMSFHIIAKIENEEMFDNSDEEIRFKEASIAIKLDALDTNRIVTATVMTLGNDGKEKPVKDIAVKFYIQRMFGSMPAAEDNVLNTDQNGVASFNYPKEMPGGEAGNITVVARIEDNELFGSVDANTNVKWGTIVPPEKNPFPRALWEPYAPPSLILVFFILFGGVWTTYIYIFYTMFKIKKDKGDDQIELEEMIKN